MRVAIVDDHAGVRSLLGDLLSERAGVDVVGEATDGDEVLALLEATNPDLVVMDYRMPRMDGVAATRALVRARPSVEVVAFTSSADPATGAAFAAAGAARHFDKSEIDELIGYVRARAVEHG